MRAPRQTYGDGSSKLQAGQTSRTQYRNNDAKTARANKNVSMETVHRERGMTKGVCVGWYKKQWRMTGNRDDRSRTSAKRTQNQRKEMKCRQKDGALKL